MKSTAIQKISVAGAALFSLVVVQMAAGTAFASDKDALHQARPTSAAVVTAEPSDPGWQNPGPGLRTDDAVTGDPGWQTPPTGLQSDVTVTSDPGWQNPGTGLRADVTDPSDPGWQNPPTGGRNLVVDPSDPGWQNPPTGISG
ncbi:hypothetical protein ACFYVL_44140 [Streptomyces sp. NPDC004111]|uniref:hypothetical protein n=1 Tax=Streptomyces sp. NPDC004111 TaxID=3364690 RepID=UPI0036C6A6F3